MEDFEARKLAETDLAVRAGMERLSTKTNAEFLKAQEDVRKVLTQSLSPAISVSTSHHLQRIDNYVKNWLQAQDDSKQHAQQATHLFLPLPSLSPVKPSTIYAVKMKGMNLLPGESIAGLNRRVSSLISNMSEEEKATLEAKAAEEYAGNTEWVASDEGQSMIKAM